MREAQLGVKADPASPCGHPVLLQKKGFLQVRLHVDVPMKGGKENFERKQFTRKRPFPAFSQEK